MLRGLYLAHGIYLILD